MCSFVLDPSFACSLATIGCSSVEHVKGNVISAREPLFSDLEKNISADELAEEWSRPATIKTPSKRLFSTRRWKRRVDFGVYSTEYLPEVGTLARVNDRWMKKLATKSYVVRVAFKNARRNYAISQKSRVGRWRWYVFCGSRSILVDIIAGFCLPGKKGCLWVERAAKLATGVTGESQALGIMRRSARRFLTLSSSLLLILRVCSPVEWPFKNARNNSETRRVFAANWTSRSQSFCTRFTPRIGGIFAALKEKRAWIKRVSPRDNNSGNNVNRKLVCHGETRCWEETWQGTGWGTTTETFRTGVLKFRTLCELGARSFGTAEKQWNMKLYRTRRQASGCHLS